MNNIPDDIINIILNNLEFDDLKTFKNINKYFCKYIYNNKNLLYNKFVKKYKNTRFIYIGNEIYKENFINILKNNYINLFLLNELIVKKYEILENTQCISYIFNNSFISIKNFDIYYIENSIKIFNIFYKVNNYYINIEGLGYDYYEWYDSYSKTFLSLIPCQSIEKQYKKFIINLLDKFLCKVYQKKSELFIKIIYTYIDKQVGNSDILNDINKYIIDKEFNSQMSGINIFYNLICLCESNDLININTNTYINIYLDSCKLDYTLGCDYYWNNDRFGDIILYLLHLSKELNYNAAIWAYLYIKIYNLKFKDNEINSKLYNDFLNKIKNLKGYYNIT